jgi:hypothetical protein
MNTKLIVSIAIVGIIVIGSSIYYVVNRQEIRIEPAPAPAAPQVQTPSAKDYIGTYEKALHPSFPGVGKSQTERK